MTRLLQVVIILAPSYAVPYLSGGSAAYVLPTVVATGMLAQSLTPDRSADAGRGRGGFGKGKTGTVTLSPSHFVLMRGARIHSSPFGNPATSD